MDLMRTMIANRQTRGIVDKPVQPRSVKPTKTERAQPGSRAMRKFIIEEKPGKKVVREHLEAILTRETESSDDE